MQNHLHLLKSKKFLPLFVTQFFGAFNDNAFKNAFLIWFTYKQSSALGIDAQIMVSVASALFILPFFLFSALAGQLADKYEKSKIIRIIKAIEIVIMFLAFFAFYLESIHFLLALIFFMGMHSTFFGPIKYSLLPEHLKNDELIGGNALIEAGTFLAILFGTIFGGIIILRNNGIDDLVRALVIFAGAGLIASLYIPKSHISDGELKLSFNIFSKTVEIIKYAKKESSVFLAIIGISWFWLIGVTFISLLPVYTKNLIRGEEHVVTLFLSIFSIGIGIGSVLCNKLLKGQINGKLVPYGALGITFGILIFCAGSYFYEAPLIYVYEHNSHCAGAINHHIATHGTYLRDFGKYTQRFGFLDIKEFLHAGITSWTIIVGLLITAICGGIYIVPLYAIMQHRSDPKYISRIIAANNVMNALFLVLASVGIMILSELKLEALEIFLLMGFANILVFFAIKKVMKIRRGEN